MSAAYVRAAGGLASTISLLFGGTATITSMVYSVRTRDGASSFTAIVAGGTSFVTTAGAFLIHTPAGNGLQNMILDLDGIITVSTAGTIIPQYQLSAAPGVGVVVQAGSFAEITEIGADTFTNDPAWA